jgi:hypothetical protein
MSTAVQQHASLLIEDEVHAAEKELVAAWQAYQKTEKHGLEFGRVCWVWRNEFKAQGSHKGLGFEQLCTKLSIPRRTAYHWMNEYELSIGVKIPRPKPESEPVPTEPEKPEIGPTALLDQSPELKSEPSGEPETEPEPQPRATTSPSARQMRRLEKAEELERQNLFPTYKVKITPAVVNSAPEGIGFNVVFQDLDGEQAVRRLARIINIQCAAWKCTI